MTVLWLQVANELKITGYSPKMAILGGRKHYCINDEVREAGSNIDEACKDKCTSNGGCKVFDKKRIPHIAARAPPVRSQPVAIHPSTTLPTLSTILCFSLLLRLVLWPKDWKRHWRRFQTL